MSILQFFKKNKNLLLEIIKQEISFEDFEIRFLEIYANIPATLQGKNHKIYMELFYIAEDLVTPQVISNHPEYDWNANGFILPKEFILKAKELLPKLEKVIIELESQENKSNG